MKIKALLVAAVLAMTLGFAGQASALDRPGIGNPQTTTAQVIGPVFIDRNDPTVGYVTAVYRCFGEGTLWVSVKQVADRSRDPGLTDDGSSSISAAWSMSHRNSVNCDGRLHLQFFTVDQVETQGFGIPPSPLRFGWGYVQFCLFDDNFPIPPENPELGTPFSNNGFHFVL